LTAQEVGQGRSKSKSISEKSWNYKNFTF
jgi:hypothetical protein